MNFPSRREFLMMRKAYSKYEDQTIKAPLTVVTTFALNININFNNLHERKMIYNFIILSESQSIICRLNQ